MQWACDFSYEIATVTEEAFRACQEVFTAVPLHDLSLDDAAGQIRAIYQPVPERLIAATRQRYIKEVS